MLKDAEKHILLQSKIPLTDVLLLVFSTSEYSTQYKFTVYYQRITVLCLKNASSLSFLQILL